jgi:putative SOS response-associated peptidase YedK
MQIIISHRHIVTVWGYIPEWPKNDKEETEVTNITALNETCNNNNDAELSGSATRT